MRIHLSKPLLSFPQLQSYSFSSPSNVGPSFTSIFYPSSQTISRPAHLFPSAILPLNLSLSTVIGLHLRNSADKLKQKERKRRTIVANLINYSYNCMNHNIRRIVRKRRVNHRRQKIRNNCFIYRKVAH